MNEVVVILVSVLLAFLIIGLFSASLYIGIRIGRKFPDTQDKASVNEKVEETPAPMVKNITPEEMEERKRLIEEQKAFRQIMDYSAAQAYGMGAASNSEAGDN